MNFIEKNTKKVALFLCFATAGSAVTTVYAMDNSTGWQNDVYIKDNGEVATGWLFTEEGTYYCDKDGAPLKGWQVIEGETYFFNAKGIKLSGEQVIDGHKYTFTEKGSLMTGWDSENTSYLNQYGEKVTGLQKIGNKTFLFDENGKIMTGWQEVGDKKVYFNEDGSLASGKTKIGNKTYNLNEDGTLSVGWVTKNKDDVYYYDKYGNMTKGWKTINDKKYYFNKKGLMISDCEYADYKFDKNGVATLVEEEEDEETSSQTVEEADDEIIVESASTGSSNGYYGNVSGSGIAGAALSQLGVNQDCTMLVTNALAANGINYHGWPDGYMSLGSITSNPQPGDLIYYADGGMGMAHIAVYIGNGQAVHGGFNGNQTVQASAYLGSGPVFIHVGN